MPNSNIYSIRVQPGKENKVRDLIINRAKVFNAWQKSIFSVLIPTEKVFTTKNGNRKVVEKRLYPGYIFIDMYLDKDAEDLVQSTSGVSSFVKTGSKAQPLTEKEVNNLMKAMEDSAENAPKATFKANDIVLVVSGAFADFTGKIESVDDIKGRVKAYINIFGRETLVELDINDVQIHI